MIAKVVSGRCGVISVTSHRCQCVSIPRISCVSQRSASTWHEVRGGTWVEPIARLGESIINRHSLVWQIEATSQASLLPSHPPSPSPLPYNPPQLSLASVSVQHRSIPNCSVMGIVPTACLPGSCLYLTHGALPVCQLVE